MVYHKSDGMCPLCGVAGQAITLTSAQGADTHNCSICGTIYNRFGIILTQGKDEWRTRLN